MIYNDPTNQSGIVQEADFYASSNASSYPIQQKTRNANRALDKTLALILGSDGRWQFDDTNYTDLPIGTTSLVNNQQDYGFASDEMLVVTRVELQDPSGKWQKLVPFDQDDLNRSRFNTNNAYIPGGTAVSGESLTDFMSESGTPLYYDKIANSIFLYPRPNYTAENALKVYFQRNPNYFEITDTTKSPGFATHLHRYIPLSMAYDYAVAKGLPKANQLLQSMLVLEAQIQDFYAYRPKDEQVVIKPRIENYR